MSVQQLKSAYELTADEVSQANARTAERIKALTPPPGSVAPASYLVLWGQAEIMQALGIRALDKETEADQPYLFEHGVGKNKIRYAADNNSTNRPLSVDNMKSLTEHFMGGTWAITGEPLIFDSEGMAASAQHRLTAAFIATLANPEAKFEFIVQTGIDSSVIDFIDTGKGRDLKDITIRHSETMLTVEELRTLAGTQYKSNIADVRKKIAADIKQAASILFLRSHGKDVNNSTTEWKSDKSLYFQMLKRFGECQFTDAQGKTVTTNTFTRAANLIYAYDTEQGGAINKNFGRGKLLAIMVLASNVDNPTKRDVEQFMNGLGKEQSKIIYTMPETLALDLELVAEFCDVASDKTPSGPLHKLYTHLASKTGKERLDPQYKFGASVNAVKAFIDTAQTQTLPATVNEAGEEVTPEVTRKVMPPLADHTVPKQPSMRGDVRPPLDWPAFGGFDVGYLSKEDAKAIISSDTVNKITEGNAQADAQPAESASAPADSVDPFAK